MAARDMALRLDIVGVGSLDEQSKITALGVTYWVQNSFICVGDPDKIQPPARRSKSLPPVTLLDGCNIPAPPCNVSIDVQRRGNGGKRCKRCRGRKGDRCRCVSKSTSRKAFGGEAVDAESSGTNLCPVLLVA